MTDHLEDLFDLHKKVECDYNKEERNLISVGFKNWVGGLQSAMRILKALGDTKKYAKYLDAIP